MSFGVFYVAILGEYGWGRGETAGAFSLAMIVHAFFAPVTGALIDRFSPRQVFPIGAAFLTLGLLGAGRIIEIWHLYFFFGVIMAIGINSIGFGPHVALIPRWFIRKRGLATGFTLAGIGIGAMVVVPMTEFFIESFGWRSAFFILGSLIFLIVVPATALFQRGYPEELGQHPDNAVTGSRLGLSSIPSPSENWAFKAALSSKAFWWVNLTSFCHGFLVNMLIVHQAVHIVDAGFSQILAAFCLGMVGMLGSLGGILFGHISDRAGMRAAITTGCGASFIGVTLLLFLHDTHSHGVLYAATILYGLGQASFSPVYVSAMGDFFPGRSLGRIMSTLSISYGLGGAISSYLAGAFYDHTGTYLIPFLLLLVNIIMGAMGIWMATRRKCHPKYALRISP
jgi:MFS family permease